MKLLKHYTYEELTSLTEDQKEELFLLECANRGVALPMSIPEYVEEPKAYQNHTPQLKAFEITNNYTTVGFVNSEEVAKAICNMLNQCDKQIDYIIEDGKLYHYQSPKKPNAVYQQIAIFSAEQVEAFTKESQAYDEKKDEYEKNNKIREKLLEQHYEIRKEISDAIENAREIIYKAERIRKMFNKYLEMAENNREIAIRFLKNSGEQFSNFNDYQLGILSISREELGI